MYIWPRALFHHKLPEANPELGAVSEIVTEAPPAGTAVHVAFFRPYNVPSDGASPSAVAPLLRINGPVNVPPDSGNIWTHDNACRP